MITVAINDKEVRAALDRLAAKVGNLEPVLTKIGLHYEESVKANFDAQKSPDGNAWKPLADATLRKGLHARKGSFTKKGKLSAKGKGYLSGKRILIGAGDLKDMIHSQADATGLVVVGVPENIKYGAIHQFGGPAGRGKKVNIPARPYLAENEGQEMKLAAKDKKMILEMIEAELKP